MFQNLGSDFDAWVILFLFVGLGVSWAYNQYKTKNKGDIDNFH